MDLARLSPAPWVVKECQHDYAELDECFVSFGAGTYDLDRDSSMMDRTHAEFIALARNAFDVMIRRGWTLYRDGGGWWVACETGAKDGNYHGPVIRAVNGSVCWYTGLRPDPFTALVEADRWYRENVEQRQDGGTGAETTP